MDKTYDVAVIVGSLRKDSVNRKVSRALAELAPAELKLSIVEIGQLPLYNQDGENKNIGQVIYKGDVPKSSIGWTEQSFFRNLGSTRNALDSLKRNAEQEYLLQGMVKGAMHEAAQLLVGRHDFTTFRAAEC